MTQHEDRGPGTWVVLPTYDEAENIGPIARRHPRGAAGRDAARRRRRLARRHRRARRRAGRGRPADPGPPPAGQAGPRPGLPRRLRRRARRRRDASSSRWTPTSATTRPSLPALIAPIEDGAADLVIGSRYTPRRRRRGLGHRPPDHLARRQPVRPDRPRASRRNDLTGGFKAWRADDPGGRPVRRRPRRRLRLPDRDDVPAEPRRCAHPRGPDHLPRPARRRRARCRAGSSSRRSSSSSSSAPRSSARRAGGAAGDDAGRDAPARRSRARGAAGPPPGVRVVMDAAAAPGSRPRAADRRPISRSCWAAFDARPARRRVVRVPARAPTSTTRPTRSRRPRRSSDGACCRRPGCCARPPLTVDPFVLRGASLGAAWRAERGGAAGRGLPRGRSGTLPIALAAADSS